VIAHRGASGYLPEHTLPAYRLAIQLGADYVEPDLVLTRDGVLVARHERQLGASTNVSVLPKFAAKRVVQTVAGTEVTDWFVEDFTLEELRLLRARETRPEIRKGNAAFDDQFPVPTLAEIIGLLRDEGARAGRLIGLYPELKEPSVFRSRGQDPEGALLRSLAAAGLDRGNAPVVIQSFDADSLKRLRQDTGLPLVQLIEGSLPEEEPAPPPDYAAIAAYAQGVGAPKELIMGDATMVSAARKAGLFVHGWTFRAENKYLPELFHAGRDPAMRGNLAGEIAAALDRGMTGFFTDHPDVGRQVCSSRD
jgi:glycerophosphoryl diester phosphodiesterase